MSDEQEILTEPKKPDEISDEDWSDLTYKDKFFLAALDQLSRFDLFQQLRKGRTQHGSIENSSRKVV